MTKYFSKDTPLASLERMMMSVPGFQKRGGGMMVLCRFHYKKEDVDCAYCQSYMRHTCQASVCPYIPERLEAGTVSYQELAEGCLHMAGHQKLWNRLSSLPKGKSLPLVLEPAHRRRLSEWLEAGIATSCPHELAAAYLLSSRAGLWRRVLPHISHGRIDFSSISLRGIDPRDYPVYRAAKGLYCGTLLITSSELADEEQVSSEAFGDILNAIEKAIRFYAGYVSGKEATAYLPPALVAAMRGTVQDSENRIARLLFKLAVEVNMMMNVLAAGMEISDEDLKTLRARSVREVKQTNGRISFKDAIDYQRGVE